MHVSTLLEARIRRMQFGERVVLRQVQLQLRAGEFVTLVGASGCGKSTLLRVIAGLERDHDGEVRLQGRALQGLTRDIGFIFQEPRLFPWLDVATNVAFDLREGSLRDASTRAQVTALLDEVGLSGLGDALPKQLSGGQAQRVAIARGLFNRPTVLLLDEPFSAVDAFTRMKLQDLLLRLARQHAITVLMVTHDIDEAVHLSDRVLVMSAASGSIDGEVVIDLPRPRDRDHPDVAVFTTKVRQALHGVHAF